MAGMRQMIKDLLRKLGYNSVTTAENGKVGYSLLFEAFQNGRKFDLILSDWNMPELSGIELLRLVRSNPDLAKTPFLLITAEREFSQVKDAMLLGVNSYVVKPFNLTTVKGKLELVWKQLHPTKK